MTDRNKLIEQFTKRFTEHFDMEERVKNSNTLISATQQYTAQWHHQQTGRPNESIQLSWGTHWGSAQTN